MMLRSCHSEFLLRYKLLFVCVSLSSTVLNNSGVLTVVLTGPYVVYISQWSLGQTQYHLWMSKLPSSFNLQLAMAWDIGLHIGFGLGPGI